MIRNTNCIWINLLFVQIENEYEPESKVFGASGYAYMTWAAKMAVGMGTGVPWVMCKEDDAPDPVVSEMSLPHSMHTSLNKSISHIQLSFPSPLFTHQTLFSTRKFKHPTSCIYISQFILGCIRRVAN